jgi:hypothetical protein
MLASIGMPYAAAEEYRVPLHDDRVDLLDESPRERERRRPGGIG